VKKLKLIGLNLILTEIKILTIEEIEELRLLGYIKLRKGQKILAKDGLYVYQGEEK